MAENSLIPQEQSSSSRKLSYLPTTAAYDRWAKVYDNDSNPLQAMDDLELETLLPKFLNIIAPAQDDGILRIVDLGCGTGRNTFKLLSTPKARIVGLDASPKMLEIARTRCEEGISLIPNDKRAVNLQFDVFDMLNVQGSDVPEAGVSDAIISTLVIEHIPCDKFFSVASSMLRPGGWLLLTNMHSDMGGKSQAGFVDPETGEKVRPTSYAHGVEDVIAAAANYGLYLVGEVKETAVDESNVKLLGKRAGKWLGVKTWFGIIFQKHEG